MKFKPVNPTDKKFRSGIYNYCDRWCDRCPDKDKCFLYAKEQQKNAEHIAKGEDIEDPEVILQDMKESFEETRLLIEKTMKARGITKKDLDKADLREQEEPDFQSNAVVKTAVKFLKVTRDFLNEFWYEQQKTFGQFGLEVSLEDVRDEIETISWYHTILPSKIWRLLYEIHHSETEEDKELREMVNKDVPKFLTLVNKCIANSKRAVELFDGKRRCFETERQKKRLKEMMELLEKIESGVRKLKNKK